MFSNSDLSQFLFGRLSLEAIPYHEPILVVTFLVVAVVGLALLAAVTWYGQWGYLWREWFTSVDHKKIGIMYIILAIVMLLRGFADAIMMITQKALAVGASEGYLPPHHYDQVFTAHGTIMIFFMAMPFVTGVMNYIMPLQIGARDVAFPFLNNFSFWMTVGGAVLTMMSSWASTRGPPGSPIRHCRGPPTAPASESITTSGAFRSRASAPRCPAST
jgi:cytochrome o ubiquinol oxidase subunit I